MTKHPNAFSPFIEAAFRRALSEGILRIPVPGTGAAKGLAKELRAYQAACREHKMPRWEAFNGIDVVETTDSVSLRPITSPYDKYLAEALGNALP